MTSLGVWFLGGMLLTQQGQIEHERLQLARERAGLVRALREIAAEESWTLCSSCIEGGHAHHILTITDRALGTKHACTMPKEWLER